MTNENSDEEIILKCKPNSQTPGIMKCQIVTGTVKKVEEPAKKEVSQQPKPACRLQPMRPLPPLPDNIELWTRGNQQLVIKRNVTDGKETREILKVGPLPVAGKQHLIRLGQHVYRVPEKDEATRRPEAGSAS